MDLSLKIEKVDFEFLRLPIKSFQNIMFDSQIMRNFSSMSGDERKDFVAQLLSSNPDRVPIECQAFPKDSPVIVKRLMLHRQSKAKNLLQILRNILDVGSDLTISLSAGGFVVKPHNTIGTIYEAYKNPEGVLVLQVKMIAAFGA